MLRAADRALGTGPEDGRLSSLWFGRVVQDTSGSEQTDVVSGFETKF